ncbi:MAG: hypothetical protein ACQXXG_09740 [Candidatus Bathyarchaeia archaeon]|nr:hypothetical protein [Candidatus Bathyarchaeota archaeon A05DMB-2]
MSKSQTRNHGKFWSTVRPLIWEKAQQLYQEDQAKTMGADYKGITATHKELREAGYFHTAKLIILRNLYLQNKNPSAPTKNSLLHFKSPTDKIKSKGGKEKTCLNRE